MILSTQIVSDVSYIADTIIMMKDGSFLVQEPVTITDSIKGKVWEISADTRDTDVYRRKYSVVNLHHENGKVRLRFIHETAPTEDAVAVEPGLEDLFLYHFGEEAGEQGEI